MPQEATNAVRGQSLLLCVREVFRRQSQPVLQRLRRRSHAVWNGQKIGMQWWRAVISNCGEDTKLATQWSLRYRVTTLQTSCLHQCAFVNEQYNLVSAKAGATYKPCDLENYGTELNHFPGWYIDNSRIDLVIAQLRDVAILEAQVALLWQRDHATRLSVEILQLTKHPI